MIDIEISKYLKETYPKLSLGVIEYNGVVAESNDVLWNIAKEKSDIVKNLIKKDEINKTNKIKDIRDAYKGLGKDPSRYRISSEALVRRILQGKDLYRVNNIVDINNIVSLESLYPVGSYDLDMVKSSINFRVGIKGEVYDGIGKQGINLENMPVFSDVEGAFGSLTSDSKRTMITCNAKNLIMIVISFSGHSDLQKTIHFAIKLLEEHAGASKIQYKII